MPRKSRVQAMPEHGSTRDAGSEINPGKAGPKGALEHAPAKGRNAPKSGPPGAEGNNTRRDFVRRADKARRR